MNKKEILLICLIICCIFSISAVSAADVDGNATDDTILTAQIDDAVSISNDLSSYSLPEDNSIVRGENDGAGSFSDLQERINSDTTGEISLDKNYTYNSSSDTSLVQGIVISKDITIKGNNFTIDALSSARIFNITSGTVKLVGINFVNGGCADVENGGSVYTSAQGLTIDNCNFTNSYAAKDGAAVYINKTAKNCIVANSTFTDNIAGDDGAAINWNGDDGTIYNITCIDNKAVSDGTSHSKGGSISITANNIIVDRSTFTDSSVTYNGGALFITGRNVNVTNCNFTNCTSDSSALASGDDLPYGGAIYILGNYTLIDSCTFDDCSAFHGGAIFINGTHATINHSIFTGNDATENGGAVYVNGTNGIIANSTLKNNIAGDDGGAINWVGDIGTIYNITCYNNNATGSTGHAKGGSIALIGSNVSVDKSTFNSSFAAYDGGALFVTGNNVDITDCDFSNCTSRYTSQQTSKHHSYGGAINIIGNNTLVSDCTFEDCTAIQGGAIYIAGINATIADSSFSNTYAKSGSYGSTNLGGAIYIKGNNANISCSEFVSSGAYQGGTIYLEGAYCTVNGSTFNDSYAAKDGGAMYSTGSYSTVSYSNFTNNKAEYDGGGIYWYGGASSQYNTVDNCIFTGNVAYAKGEKVTTGNNKRTTFGGGALYWSEGGFYGTLKNSKFYNNSVQSDQKADGGAVLWDKSSHGVIDNCIFEDNYATSTFSKTMDWVQGGALFLRVTTNFTVSNCEFKNSSSISEAGAAYFAVAGKGTTVVPIEIFVVNTTFINNVAKAQGDNINGGGAVQIKDSDTQEVTFRNVTFINNTANKGGAVVAYNVGSNIKFYDCTFEGNNATEDGGSIWTNKNIYLYNTKFINNTAGNLGGGLYTTVAVTYDRMAFINNTAYRGGGLYWTKNNRIEHMDFINNTAYEGGGIYTTSGVTVSDVNCTGNKAFSGSAIYSTGTLILVDVYLIENQANSSSASSLTYTPENGNVVLLFKGMDNYLNALYLNVNNNKATNVTYWSEDGIDNTGSSQITLSGKSTPTPEEGQNFTFRIYDNNGNLLKETSGITDVNGKINLNIADLLPSIPTNQYDLIYIEAELTKDDYYTMIEFTTRGPSEINASATNTTYHSNTTISVNVSSGATGNVSVYLNDTFVCNITLDADAKGSINMDTILEGEFIPAGNHTLTLVYNGNFKYFPSNTTTILEIRKITPTLIINATEDSYCIDVNVTVIDEELNTSIPTGTVTLEIDGRVATIKLVNGTGSTRFAGIPIGNYTLNGNYSGDNNYNSVINSTDVNVTTKQQTVVYIDVDVRDIYWVNETVHINVTVFPNATGNLTLYLNGVPHNLTLVNSTASFDATDLIGGPNHILVTYNGDNDNAPSWGEASFYVIKFNATVEINATNITVGDKEIINFTLPENATGILNVTINGTRHYVEIINGTATLTVYELPVGVYNVTAYFNGDRYYYNATNSTLFNVSKATANITISVDNVTYGNDAVIVVTVPEGVTGNITLTINETTVVFGPENITDGKATFIVENLPAGNYTIDATYNGDGSHAVSTAKANFTVYKADVELEIEVHDIPYGNVEDIIVTVRAKGNAQGNVTITVAGNTTTIVLGEEKTWVLKATQTYEDIEDYTGTATWHIYNLAVGTYPVTATYNGNENFNVLTKDASFIVYQINTTLDVDVHDILVWDKESINVTLAKNTTGNVIININGENHTVPITNGTAQLNLTNLTVGHKVVWVFYDGDRNYTANRTMVEFDVGQRDPLVNVTALNVTVDQDGKITINIPANATGYVILSGNFTEHPIYVDEFTDGVAEITVDDLAVGNYSVHIKYYGDALDNYTVAENDTTFKVDNINTTISIDVESIDYGDKANITVTVNDDATGHITIKINETRNITLPIADGKVNWIVEGLAADNYTVYANYSGDDKYNGNKTNKTFEVRQISPNIEIVYVDSTAGENATIIVRIDPRTTENVTVHVDKDYSVKPVNGIAIITTDVLDYGEYTINASYVGDKNFTKDYDIYEFTTNQTDDYLINITASDIYVGNNTNITVNVPEDATGKVIIELNGTNYTCDINEDGIAVLNNVSTLEEGVYNVTAYFGNDKYVNKTASTRFVVSKVDSPIKVDVENLYVDDTAHINVTVPDDADGTVTIEINGVSYGPESVTDGVARFVVPNVTYGNKTVAVTYSGTDKYVSNFTTTNFTVSKLTPVVNVTNITITDGKDAVINISGPSDRDGNLVVNVDGVDYAVNMTGGNATLTVEGLSVDNYTVSVTYIENDKYAEGTASGWVNVTAKGTSAINIGVEDVYYVGQEIVITLTPVNSTGNISVTINGKEYNVTDNKVTFENGLPNDTYEIVAVLDADDNYYGSSANATFAVVKNNINITVANSTTPDTIVVGTPVTFTAELNESVTGDVVFTINGANYTVHITDSNVATYEYTPVNNATITVVATFIGNDKYNGNVSAAKEFPVSRIPTDINVTVKTPVAYGDDAVITVELNATINATVKLIVDDKEYDVAIVNGKGGFNASGLNSGDHKVNVTYVGDDKYAGSENSTDFTVDNATLVADVTAFNVTVEQNTTFVINVTDDFKGNVSIKVGDQVLYNGTVETLIYADKLPAGDKTATVVFYGDSNYDELTIPNVEFTVSRVTPAIDVAVDDVTYPNKAVAVITVGNDANGTVNVTVDDKVFNGTVSNGVASVDLTNLSAGNKVVTVEFFANDDYNGNATAGTKFIIYPNNSLIKIQNNTEIYKVGEDIEIVFDVINSTGDLKIYLNGKQYGEYLHDNPDSHVVCFDDLEVGNYTITAVLDGDQNYTGYTTTGSFKVVKNNITINVSETTVPASIVVGSPVNFTANLNESVTGDVIFTINGANYTVHIADSNVATYEYTPVNNATITVVATFVGNDKYNGNVSAAKEFLVNRIPTDINVTVKTPVAYGDDAVITVELNVTINATVKLTVDGKDYNVGIINGKGGFNASGLNSENHDIGVIFAGDDKYAGSENSTSFTMGNANLTADVVALNVTVEENTTFVINVTDDFKGNVSIKVGDQVLYNGTVKTLINADKLPAGDKTATVVFYGDSNYDELTIPNVEFIVSRVIPTINVTIDDVTYPDKAVAIINVSNKANGTVKVTVDGKVFNGTVSDGVASVDLTNLSAGSKVVDVEFLANDDYNDNATASTKFNVLKANITIDPEASGDMVVDGDVNITFSVPKDIDGIVNVTIDGQPVSGFTIDNGTCIIPGTYGAGNHTVVVTLTNDTNYEDAMGQTTFNIGKVDPEISIGDISGNVGDVVDVTVTIEGGDATGYVLYDGAYYPVENGEATIPVTLTTAGQNVINVTYTGDDKYNNGTASKQYDAGKANSSVEIISVVNATYPDDVVVSFEVDNVTDISVVISKDGTPVDATVVVDEDNKTVTISGLGAGVYTINITNAENENYYGSSDSALFNVSKAAPVLEVSAVDVTYPDDVVVTVISDAAGDITVTVGDKNVTDTVEAGVAKDVIISGLAANEEGYDIIVSLAETANYTSAVNDSETVRVMKAGSSVVIDDIADVTYNASVEVTYTIENETSVTVVVKDADGNEITSGVDTTTPGKVIISGLNAGEYIINITNAGDANHTASSDEATFNVLKATTTIDSEATGDMVVDGDVNITFSVPKDIDGIVNVTIDGQPVSGVTIVNGTCIIPGTYGAGNHTVVVTLTNDTNYEDAMGQTTFNIGKVDPEISISDISGNVGDVVDATVTIAGGDATGYVLYDGAYYPVENGEATIPVTISTAGQNVINVTYTGDDKYYNGTANKQFNAGKANSSVEIFSVVNATYPDDVVVSFEVDNVTDISVSIFKDGTPVEDVTVVVSEDNKTVTISGLGVGVYTIDITNAENENYYGSSDSALFNVSKAAPVIEVSAVDVTYPDDVVVTVISDASGDITVTVGDKTVTETVDAGVAKDVIISGLAANEEGYDITVSLAETANYTSAVNDSETVRVMKAGSSVVIDDIDDVTYNASVEVTYTIENETSVTVVVKDADGNEITSGVDTTTPGKVIISGLNAGEYIINITNAGDANHTASSDEATFNVLKATITIDPEASGDLVVDGDVNITFSVPTDIDGMPSVTIDGEPVLSFAINNGTCTIPGTYAAGNHTVVVTLEGDTNYEDAMGQTTFEVVQRDSFIHVDATNSTVDGEVVINVTVPEDAEGYVVVNVNGTTYSINLTAGEDSVTITVVEDGLYNVTVTYLGDDKFLPSNNTTTFKVDKLPSFVNITVNNDGIIANGSDAVIVINAPSDITGKVNVTVWDMTLNINTTFTVYVNEGEGTLHLEAPEIGNYNVTAVYIENRKYLGSENYTLFEVYNTAKELYVLSDDIYVKQNETISVNIPGEHVGGKVTIIISNASGQVIRNETVPITSYTSTYDYSYAKWTLPVLDAGHYDVKAIYIETDRFGTYVYEGNNSFNVIKLASEITIKEIKNITVGDNVTIELELAPSDATGNISVFVNGFEYKTTTDNLTIIIPNLNADEYDVQAFYYGDKNYNESNASSSFKVDKNIVPMSINVTNSKVGEVEQINVTVGNNATGQILLDIGDNHYYANITDGVAQFNITGLKADEYNVTATYIENNNYYGNTTNATVTISKSNSTITVQVDNITVGDVAAVNITVITGASGNVTITIGNEYNKTVGVVNGTVNVVVDGLTVGNKTVNVTYNGNDQFLPSSNSTNFTVNPADTSMIIDVENITYGDVETVIVYINATGNVTIKLNGETYDTKEISGGKVVFPIEGLNAGNYTVEAIYTGDGDSKPSSAEANFTVEKADPIITIEVKDIIYGDVEHIIVHVNAEGNVTIKVDGRVVDELTLENGKAVLRASQLNSYNGNASVDVYDLQVGNYPVEVIFNGNENYNTATETADFDVLKAPTNVSVEINPAMGVDETQVMNITINNTNATGEVIINVDGKNYTRTLKDGKANFTLEGLAAGNHSVVVIYEGDRNLTGNWTSAIVEVTKLAPEITVNATNITVGDKTLIEVTAPSDATRPVLVDVDGVGYYVNLTDGKGSLEVPISKEGTYNVTARYLGDDRYTNDSASTVFEASKVSSSVNVSAENITVGDKAVIEVSVPEDATGNVTVTVGGKDYNVSVSDGKGTLVVPDLEAGNYTVEVKYLGDDKYEESTNATEFEVSKAKVDDIKVIDQQNGTITIVVGDNATGNVTVKVGNETYNTTVVDGIATVDLVNNTPGTYDVEVIYSGDDTHEPATGEGTATIPKLNTPISVDVSDIYVDDVAMINVTVPDDAKGKVRIEIDGEEYFADIEDGVARFEVENLTAGVKTVYVSYVGDNNYTGNHTSANFTVSKVSPEITVVATNVTVGDTVIIDVTGPSDATGPVFVDVDGVDYYVNLTDGKASLTIPVSNGGTHDVTARYLGDDKYSDASASTVFEASKVPSSVNVTAENITVGDKAVIEVSVPEDATGNVTVTVDGKDYNVSVSGGKGILVVPDLEAGNYTVEVKYLGDDKYEESTNATEFEVSKAKVDDIKVIDQQNGTIAIVVGDNATGNVTVKVGNETYNATVVDGIATVDLVNNTPGTYDVEVIYSGDDAHEPATGEGTATIPKLNTPISVDVSDIYVDDVARINVTVPDDAAGEVRIEIDGKEYFAPIEDGVARFEVENLTAGVKTVYVSYVGDDNYTGNHTSGNFTVNKATPEITVSATNTTVGNKTLIEVTAPSDATMPVLVDVDGVGYYINLTDGKGSIEVPISKDGTHDVTARYPGDDKYADASANTTFEASKVPSTINVTAENITVGDKAVINVSVPEDVCGNVTVTVDGKNYTVFVSGGHGTLAIPDLEAGEYTVDAIFAGCKKYEPSNATTKFTVSKEDSDITVIDQGNGTVVVVVGDNATGEVTVKVGNNTYNATVVDGKAVVDLDNETPGVHDIEVIYSGDDKHSNGTATSKVTIPKLETPISVEVNDTHVGDTAEIVVNVPDNATGNVTIEIDGKEYTAPIKDGKATFNVENLTDGGKTIAVKYDGDDNYMANSTTANITVFKNTPEIKLNATVDGDDIIIDVTAPEDATNVVLIDVNGVGYYVNVTDGEGHLVISDVAGGDYDIVAKYPGDDKYYPSDDVTASVNVSDVPSFVSAKVNNITYGDDAVVEITVPSDATGNVTVTIDGKDYPANVSNGKAIVIVPGLEAGNYTVGVSYSGDDKYASSSNTTELEVSKADNNIKVVDQGNGTVVVIVPENATGNVTVKVGNNTYTAEVVNGTATIDLTNETPGVHDIEVVYSGDDNHNPAAVNGTATIPKVEAPISVDVDNIKVGDTAVITVNVPEDATGNVTIEIDGVKYTEEIKDGKATFNIEDLTAGNKTIAVDYAGDDKYLGNHTTAKITVSKRESEVSATITDSNVGENVTVTVTVPDDATGQVLIDIDGVGYYVNVTDGTGTVEIPRIPSGVYNVTVTYTGDDKYLSSSNTTTFNVNKVESFVIPQAQDIYVGDNEQITFLVPEDATGTITVVIDGNEYDFELDEDKLSIYDDTDESYVVAVSYGKGKLTVSGLPRGEYIVSARYNGDDKYLPSTNTTTFKVLKKSPIMDVTDLGNGTVVVDLPDDATGTVAIKVGNNTYNATVVDGKAVIDLTNETPGTHDIEVTYSGDNKYNSDVEDSTATIPKYDTPISVEVGDINVGDTAVVTVTLPDDATGTVTIEINGKEYTADIKDGKAVFIVAGLEAGNKTVAVKYAGDDNYVGNSTTGQFTVSKVNSTIDASGKNITVGNDEVITVNVPSDATGRVLVEIDGVGYYGTIINGKAKIIIPELPSGEYTVTVTYEGDDKYLPSSTTASFTVTKSDDPISATGDEITEGEDATVVVTLPEDATGTVTIVVDGKEYTTDVKDGKAVFDIPDLTEGNYNVEVYYSGDKKYDANSTTTEIIVHGKSSEGEGVDEVNVEPPVTELSLHPTGNPILALLLVMLVIGSTQLRRFKK